jgi:hypothetical protein
VNVDLCTTLSCSAVIGHQSALLSPASRTAVVTFSSLTIPNTFYVRISGNVIFPQIQSVTFGATPQTIMFNVF